MSVLDKLKHHYREAKATLEGKAISKARMIKPLTAIDATQMTSRPAPKTDPQRRTLFFRGDVWKRRLTFTERMRFLYDHRPQPTKIGLRLLNGHPVVFYTDGSLRHVYGRKVAKAAYKKLKEVRRRKMARTLATA